VSSSIDHTVVDFWTDSGTNVLITNTDVDGAAVVKLEPGATSDTARIVYGNGGGADELIFSSRETEDTANESITFDNNGNVTLDGDLAVNGDEITCDGTLTLDVVTDIVLDADGGDLFIKDNGTEFANWNTTTLRTNTRGFELNNDETAASCYIDMHVAGQTDFGLRVSRSTGADGDGRIDLNGTGDFYIRTNDAGTVALLIDSSQDVTFKHDVTIDNKLTVTGVTDPPAVLYDYATRRSTIALTKSQIPSDKLTGAMMFYNGETDQMELFFPTKGEFRSLATNKVLEVVEPIVAFDSIDSYYVDRNTGVVRKRQARKTREVYEVKDGYALDETTGKFIKADTEEEVSKEGALKIRTVTRPAPSKIREGQQGG